MEKDSGNGSIIPPVKDQSPEDALRAFMQVDRKKVLEAEKREGEEGDRPKEEDG